MAKRGPIETTVLRAMRTCGLTRYELSARTGVDQGALSRFVAGKTCLNLRTLDRLADLIGIRVVVDRPQVKAANVEG